MSGLEAKILASASKIWPRSWLWPRSFGLSLGLGLKHLPQPGLDLVVLLCNRAFFGQKSCKIREFLLIFLAIILNRMLLIITWYFFHNYVWPRPWPQPPEIGLGLGLGLGLEVLASFNITAIDYAHLADIRRACTAVDRRSRHGRRGHRQ